MRSHKKRREHKELQKLEERKRIERIEKEVEEETRKIKIFKLEEIDFETNLNITDILEVVDKFIQKRGIECEVCKNNITYETISDGTREPLWYVPVIDHFDEPEFLMISDSKKKVVAIQNNVGRIIEF